MVLALLLPVWAGDFVGISRGCLRGPIRYSQGFNAAGPIFGVDLFWVFVIRCLSSFSVARAVSCPFRVASTPRMCESPAAIRTRLRPVPRLSLTPRSTQTQPCISPAFHFSRSIPPSPSKIRPRLGRLTFFVRAHHERAIEIEERAASIGRYSH